MTHLLLIFFVTSLLSGLIALLMTGLVFFNSFNRDYLKRAALILSFSLLIIADTLSFYIYNIGTREFSRGLGMADVAIPCLIFTLPLYFHTFLDVSFSKVMDKIFLVLSLILGLLLFLGELFFTESSFYIYFVVSGSILAITILYTCILVILAKKDSKNSCKNMAVLFGICGLLLFPGFVLVDIFQNVKSLLVDDVPFAVLFVPFFYLFINTNFIIHDARLLLKVGNVPDISTLSGIGLEQFKLSPREKEVCQLLLCGKKYSDIADSLCISLSTVKTHIKNIYEKCGVSGKMELINLLFS